MGSRRINTNNSFGTFSRAGPNEEYVSLTKKDKSVLFLTGNTLNQPVVTFTVNPYSAPLNSIS